MHKLLVQQGKVVSIQADCKPIAPLSYVRPFSYLHYPTPLVLPYPSLHYPSSLHYPTVHQTALPP